MGAAGRTGRVVRWEWGWCLEVGGSLGRYRTGDAVHGIRRGHDRLAGGGISISVELRRWMAWGLVDCKNCPTNPFPGDRLYTVWRGCR